MSANGQRLLLVALAVSGIGCDSEVGLSPGTTGEREGRTVLHDDLLDFSAEGDWLVSPPLSLVAPIDRVGVMAETTDAQPLTLRARTGVGEAWTPLSQLSVDGSLSVLAHRFEASVSEVQLSVRAADGARLVFLKWAATPDRVPPFEDRPGADEEPLPDHLREQSVLARSEWGAMPARCLGADVDDGPKNRVSFHHTLTPEDGSTAMVKALQRYAGDGLGFCDGGFHFLIAPDGTVHEGRPLRFVSGHAGDEDPRGNVSIAFMGCYDTGYCGALGGRPPTGLAVGAATRLLTALALADGFPIDGGTVRGFSGCGGPSAECAGDLVLAELPGIIMRASEALPTPTTHNCHCY